MTGSKEVPVLETLKKSFNTATCPVGLGAIEIISHSSRIAARIYVDNRHVYGIEISNFPIEVIRRVITSEHISEKHCDELLGMFSENLSDARIADFVLQNSIIPMSVLIVYLKDLFLGACDYIGMIPMAEVNWKEGVRPKNTPVPEIDLDRLWGVLENRKKDFKRIADIFGVGEWQVRNLKFKLVENTDLEITQLTANIYSLASGEWSILDFARQFGLSLYLSSREIQKLWIAGKLNVIYDNEFILKAPSLEESKSEERVTVKTKVEAGEDTNKIINKEPIAHAKPIVSQPSPSAISEAHIVKEVSDLDFVRKRLEDLEKETVELKALLKKMEESE